MIYHVNKTGSTVDMDWNVRTFKVAVFQPFTEAANWTIKRWKSAFFTPGRGTVQQCLMGVHNKGPLGHEFSGNIEMGLGSMLWIVKIVELCLSHLCDLFFGEDPSITNLSNPHQRGPAKVRTWGANMLDHVGICLPLSEMRNFHLAKNPKTPPTLPYQVWLSYSRLTEFSWY